MIVTALIGVAVFFAAITIDFSHAKCVRALIDGRRHAAALWSVLQWTGAVVGFVAAVKESMWYLPLEGAGLYIGTLLGSRSPPG